ncbi:hypothetical protein PHLCEN_2v13103 [Hermanssonia centrifuga]|uniref:Uncharacterized protein n=1 Tax=Hermanssonia centrifuga TaxID=98765 RepID=A0A2R6NFD9_9APHY|nr:hypothetical protein PHLCEN_2v13103 [Hermanssonia centrifuga]
MRLRTAFATRVSQEGGLPYVSPPHWARCQFCCFFEFKLMFGTWTTCITPPSVSHTPYGDGPLVASQASGSGPLQVVAYHWPCRSNSSGGRGPCGSHPFRFIAQIVVFLDLLDIRNHLKGTSCHSYAAITLGKTQVGGNYVVRGTTNLIPSL